MRPIKETERLLKKLLKDEINLARKIDKLHNYLSYERKPYDVSEEEFLLLCDQIYAMMDYYDMMTRRIEYLRNSIELH